MKAATSALQKPRRLSFAIRNGRGSDAAAVQKIAFAIMPLYGLVPDPEGLDSALGHFGQQRDGVFLELVAEVMGTVVGSVLLKREEAETAQLTGFYVDQNFRGYGIGRALLHEAIQRARHLGYASIYLETWGKMVEAVHLYETFGWVRGPDVAP